MLNLMQALAKFQQECPTIPKKSQAKVTTSKGGSYSYNYADLPAIMEAITPILQKHGLMLIQPLISTEGKTYVRTELWHLESGESIQSDIEVFRVSFSGMNDYQALGSGITYFRRYALSMLGIITDEDTDAHGEQTSKPVKKELPWLSEKAFNSAVRRIQEASPNVVIEIDGNQQELTPTEFVDKIVGEYRMKKDYKAALLQEVEFQNTLNKIPDSPQEIEPKIPY